MNFFQRLFRKSQLDMFSSSALKPTPKKTTGLNFDKPKTDKESRIGDLKSENGKYYIFLETTTGKPRWHTHAELHQMAKEGKPIPEIAKKKIPSLTKVKEEKNKNTGMTNTDYQAGVNNANDKWTEHVKNIDTKTGKEKPTEKEAYELSVDEYIDQMNSSRVPNGFPPISKNKNDKSYQVAKNSHKIRTQKAISEGKEVSPKAINDHEDIKKIEDAKSSLFSQSNKEKTDPLSEAVTKKVQSEKEKSVDDILKEDLAEANANAKEKIHTGIRNKAKKMLEAKEITQSKYDEIIGKYPEGLEKEKAKEEKKSEKEETDKSEQKKIPQFKSTNEAVEFGKTATPEQIEELKKLHKESGEKFSALTAVGTKENINERIQVATNTQFYQESFEASEKKEEPLKFTTTEEFLKSKGLTKISAKKLSDEKKQELSKEYEDLQNKESESSRKYFKDRSAKENEQRRLEQEKNNKVFEDQLQADEKNADIEDRIDAKINDKRPLTPEEQKYFDENQYAPTGFKYDSQGNLIKQKTEAATPAEPELKVGDTKQEDGHTYREKNERKSTQRLTNFGK